MFETFLGVSGSACVASPLLIMGIPSSSTKPLLLRTMPIEGTVQLAVNYSTIAAKLVQTGSIDIDLFKCPDRASVLETARRQRPVYVHFSLTAGCRTGAAANLGAISERLIQTGTPYVNTRLDPQIEPQAGMMGTLFKAIKRTLHDVRTLVACFGANRVIVENAPYVKGYARHGSMAAETAFIRQVVEETGCGFLLNLAHARLAAQSMGMETRLYLSRLPVKKLRVLHVSGTSLKAGSVQALRPMADLDWELFDWAVGQIREGNWATPRIIAFEYGGVGSQFEAHTDAAVLTHQLACLHQGVQHLSDNISRVRRSSQRILV